MTEKQKKDIKIALEIIKETSVGDWENFLDSIDIDNNVMTKLQLVSSKNTLDKKVARVLHVMGMPANILGYKYVKKAIMLVIEDPTYMSQVVKRLYKDIASEYETKPNRVERAIRHAIEVTCERGSLKMMEQIFGLTIINEKGKPTNSEFISMLAEMLS